VTRSWAGPETASRAGRPPNPAITPLTDDPAWAAWSADALTEARDNGALVINPIVYAEVSAGFDRIEGLDDNLPTEDFQREALPYEAAFVAGKAVLAYRRRGGQKRSPLDTSRGMGAGPHEPGHGCGPSGAVRAWVRARGGRTVGTVPRGTRGCGAAGSSAQPVSGAAGQRRGCGSAARLVGGLVSQPGESAAASQRLVRQRPVSGRSVSGQVNRGGRD